MVRCHRSLFFFIAVYSPLHIFLSVGYVIWTSSFIGLTKDMGSRRTLAQPSGLWLSVGT